MVSWKQGRKAWFTRLLSQYMTISLHSCITALLAQYFMPIEVCISALFFSGTYDSELHQRWTEENVAT